MLAQLGASSHSFFVDSFANLIRDLVSRRVDFSLYFRTMGVDLPQVRFALRSDAESQVVSEFNTLISNLSEDHMVHCVPLSMTHMHRSMTATGLRSIASATTRQGRMLLSVALSASPQRPQTNCRSIIFLFCVDSMKFIRSCVALVRLLFPMIISSGSNATSTRPAAS